jgi:predicted N-formylglutamate amidohydrolase
MTAAFGHIVVTCEHATNRVPDDLAARFKPHRTLLKAHRGYDIGALPIANILAASLAAPLFVGEVSRLVVELNRSPDSASLFSVVTRDLDDASKRAILDRYYTPWRAAVRDHIARALKGPVLHLSVHSFTPVLDGKKRELELGLLFDHRRAPEKSFCERLRRAISADPEAADLRVKMNLPYRGTSDGHTTALRREFPASRYMGIEVEVRNDLIASDAGQRCIGAMLARAFRLVSGA